MQQSDSIKELATALSKAQAEMGAAHKDASNPFYKSRYADLESVIDAVKPALAKYGLSVVQMTDEAEPGSVCVETQIMHSSGEWLRGKFTLQAKDNSPQALGSVFSYGKRYALQAALMVPSTDDDAEAAQGRANSSQSVRTPKTAQVAPLPPDDLPADWPKEIKPSPNSAPKTANPAFGDHPLPEGTTQNPMETMIRSTIKAKNIPDSKVKVLLQGIGKQRLKDLNEEESAQLLRALNGIRV